MKRSFFHQHRPMTTARKQIYLNIQNRQQTTQGRRKQHLLSKYETKIYQHAW